MNVRKKVIWIIEKFYQFSNKFFGQFSSPILTVDIKEVLESMQALRTSGVRLGLPDDPAPVKILEPEEFYYCLNEALYAFRDLRKGTDFIVSVEINSYPRSVWVRFLQSGTCEFGNGKIEPGLKWSFRNLRTALEKCGGGLHYWGGNNYFDLSLPFFGNLRENFPNVEHLDWNERYRLLMERASWDSLQQMVFRFSNYAESFAERCAEFGLTSILIPSVGLCVHPWQFAEHGLKVVATDFAESALDALSEPHRRPRMYSRSAFEQWDTATSAMYRSHAHLFRFSRMPDLEDQGVRDSLQQNITFEKWDWANLLLKDQSIDAIFATNALPRTSLEDQLRVLKEWIRVVKPGGMVLIVQHNFLDRDYETFLLETGWVKLNILNGERQNSTESVGFQTIYTSG